MIVELANYERMANAVEATPDSLRAQMELAEPPFECIVAEDGSEAVGFALFFHNYSTWRGKRGLYLEDLFVLPAARGKGAGKALLLALARVAAERDCARMEWSVLDWNQPAIEFYKALGAVEMSGWHVYRLTDEALAAAAASGPEIR